MKSALVILNWNSRDYLRRFLPGLLASARGTEVEVIVADNGSTDGSQAVMRSEFPDVRLIELNDNYGFTGGYNRALAQIDAEYYLLLNSDIEVPEGWLPPLLDWMDSHPKCGACGPKILSYADRNRFEYAGAAGGFVDKYGYPFCQGRVLRWTEQDHGQYDQARHVLWVSGAALLVRSRVWKELGGLDERFFAHMEEIDLCWRMQRRGWQVDIVPASQIYHIGGGTLPNNSPFKLRLNYRNNLLLLDKNLAPTLAAAGIRHPRFRAGWRLFVRMLLDGMSGIVYLCSGKFSFCRAVVEAHREFRHLRKQGPVAEPETDPTQHIHIEGLYPHFLIPRALWKREKIGPWLKDQI